MNSALPKETPADDSREALIFGICDHLYDHGNCVTNVVLAPAKADGTPDWANASPVNLEALPADEWPEDPVTERRAAVIIDHVAGCSKDSSFLYFFDDNDQLHLSQIAGRTEDRAIIENIVARDLDLPLAERPASPMMPELADLAERFEKKHEQEHPERYGQPPAAANDNHPLARYLAAYGGPDSRLMADIVYNAVVDGVTGNIKLIDGKEIFVTRHFMKPIELPAQAAPSAFRVVDPTDWHNQPIPDREWFLPSLIPARNVTLLSGDGGVGKSLLALQIGAAASIGAETLGHRTTGNKVFYLGAEDEEDEFKRRLSQILAAQGMGFSDLAGRFRLSPMAGEDATLATPDRQKAMQPTAVMAALIDEVTDFRPNLLVLDTSADLFGGDEINRVQVRQFVGMLRKLAMAIDCAVLLLSHPSIQGMQSGSGLSGSTAWNNSVRSRLYLTAVQDDEDARMLTTVKANYGKKGGGIKMRWENGVFSLDDGKPGAGSALVSAKAARLFKEMLSMLNRQGRNVCHVPGTTYAPAVMAKLPEADGMPKARLVDAMNTLLQTGDVKIVKHGSASRERQKLILASEDFGPSES